MAPSTAEQLKAEGNAFFIKKDFVRAYDKYSEAIAIDGQNAVLYANRSACSFGMSNFIDAVHDAHQATEIDPTYAKGWSRLASAHDASKEYTNAIEAWQNAIDALPKTDLSPAERKQKEQYTTSLDKTKQRLETASSTLLPGIVVNEIREKLPWQVAEEMLPELHAAGAAGYMSSAYVIHFANREFVDGVGHMKTLKKVPIEGDPSVFKIFGHTSGLTCITNGLMRDFRVFRFDSQDWVPKLYTQMYFEAGKYNAWTEEPVDVIQRSALERLKKKGWDDVRPALSVVIRGWIMRAIFDKQLKNASHVAVERLKQTLELLHWGRQVWRDVSKDDRGVIFQDTFVVGVKVIYLDALMEAHAKGPAADKKAHLDTLLEAANELLEDTQRIVPTAEPVDPGFVSSFKVYPAAHARGSLGYYFVQMARSGHNPTEQKMQYLRAVGEYIKAANRLPEDDEKHCWYLNCAIHPMMQADVPMDMRIEIVRRIRATMPKMQRIWANSALAKQGRDVMLETGLRVAEGKCDAGDYSVTTGF
ncbi:hypothetical protein HD554DRAFT_582539 [Boletus coccyginus]|nr:hypothetical protein HD554DRAFT_582539 [Boletus coccyginus]